jgi:hypothetical protein
MPSLRSKTTSGLSLRAHVIILVILVLVPILGFASLVFWRYYQSELSRIETDLLNEARDLALAIDREHGGLVFTLQTFAISRLITNENYPEVYRRAVKVHEITGVNILMRNAAGQQVLNTRVPYGTPLPPPEVVEGDEEVRRTLQPYISGVIVGSVAGRKLYTITVPALSDDGGFSHYLHFSLGSTDWLISSSVTWCATAPRAFSIAI